MLYYRSSDEIHLFNRRIVGTCNTTNWWFSPYLLFFLCAEDRSERYDAICLFIQLSRHCIFSFLSSSIATKYPPFLSTSFLGQTQMHKSGLLGIGTYFQFYSIPPFQIISKVKIRMVFQIGVTVMINVIYWKVRLWKNLGTATAADYYIWQSLISYTFLFPLHYLLTLGGWYSWLKRWDLTKSCISE